MSIRTHSPPAPRVGFVSLGCPKALVDSEQILTQLRAEGYAICADLRRRRPGRRQHLRLHRRRGRRRSLDAIGEALARERQGHRHRLPRREGRAATSCATRIRSVLAVTGPHATHGGDGGRARAPAEAARSVRRPRAAAGHQAHAAALRVPRRSAKAATIAARSASSRRCAATSCRGPIGDVLARGRAPAAGRRAASCSSSSQDTERLRRRRPLPHRLLAGPAGETRMTRARARARRARARPRRMGAAALRLSVSARRRDRSR